MARGLFFLTPMLQKLVAAALVLAFSTEIFSTGREIIGLKLLA